jgi:hypothetical protein
VITTPPYEWPTRITAASERRARTGRDVVGKRCRRVLDDTDFIALLLEVTIDVFPAGAVDETAVDKNNGRGCCICDIRHDDLLCSR